MTINPDDLQENVPPKGFLSDILADDARFKEEKSKSSKPKPKTLETFDQLPQANISQEINVDSKTPSALNLSSPEVDELFSILNTPPHYYLFSDVPEVLIPPFPNVKRMYLGVKMIDTARTMPNGTMQPIKIHKMFMALLIDPPKYEDVVKSHEATAHESSFGYNLVQECFYRWSLSIQNHQGFREYMTKCEKFGIKFVMNYSEFLIVNHLENDVREV